MDFDAEIIKKSIDKYNTIMSMIDTTPVTDPNFQTIFNGFYRIRFKNSEWYKQYYATFEDCQKNSMTFEKVLKTFYEKTNYKYIGPSFCSKIIATLDPQKPIIDKYVLQWLGITKNYEPNNKDDKIEYFVDIYNEIIKEYNDHLDDPNIIESIKSFDEQISEGKNITKIKKIDFMLWSNREPKTVSIFDYDKLLYYKNHQ